MSRELKQFFCNQCTWRGQEFFDPKNGFNCPSCGNILATGSNFPHKTPANPYFEQTEGGKPGFFLVDGGRWQFVCECGHGEIWATKQLTLDNYTTHQKLHTLVDEIKMRKLNEIIDKMKK